jgi:ESF2/ABP1 family protein
MDKRVAKTVAATLNNQIMGGKKSNYYHDDIWNLKYLSKFKWIHLNEQLAYERQERQKKLQMETEQAKKEIGAYLRNVDQSKMLQAMEQKRKRKAIGDSNGGSSEQNASNGTTDEAALQAFRRRFKQRKVVDDTETGGLATNGLSNSLLNQLLT